MKEIVLVFMGIFLFSQVLALDFCEYGVAGEENLRIISVDDMLVSNSEEWTWDVSEDVEIEVRVENRGEEDGDYVIELVLMDGNDEVDAVKDSDDLEEEFSLETGERRSVSFVLDIDDKLDVGGYDLYVKFYKDGDEDLECVENSEVEVLIEKVELCREGNDEDLNIDSIIDESDVEKEWVWVPGDEIDVLVDFENIGYSERNFVLELIMINEDKEEIVFAADSSNLIEDVMVNEDELREVEFDFELLGDIEEGEYLFYARAYDEEDEDICTSLKAETGVDPVKVLIERPERKVVVDDVSGPNEAEIFSGVSYDIRVSNLGNKDEDRVAVFAYNYKLDVKEFVEIFDLESGDSETITISFNIPGNISLEKYPVLFSTEYEYDSKSDFYRSESDSDDDIKYFLTVLEGVVVEEMNLSIEENVSKEEIIEEENVSLNFRENETIIEEDVSFGDVVSNDSGVIMTGNVVGSSGDSSSFGHYLFFVLLIAVVGIFSFFKFSKDRGNRHTEIEPRVIRKYVASLD